MTHFHELFPSGIFDDPKLVLVNAYCLSRMKAVPGKIRLRGEIVAHTADEALIARNPSDPVPGVDEAQFEAAITELQDIGLCTVKKTEKYFLVSYPKHIVDAPPPQSQATVAEDGITPITFNAFIPIYLDHKTKVCKIKTVDNSERVTKLFAAWYGDMLIHELRPKHLEDYMGRRFEEKPKLSKQTVNLDVKTLKELMEYAVQREYTKENQFRKVKLLRVEKRKKLFFSEDQIEICLSYVKNQTLRKLYRFGLLTGMRRGEVVFLLRSDIDMEQQQGVIHIRASKYYSPKADKERELPMTEPIREILNEVMAGGSSEFVFADKNGQHFNQDCVTKTFKRAIRFCELNDGMKFHTLRATFATWTAASGATPFEVKELMGHTYVKTTEEYTGVPTANLRRAMERAQPGRASTETCKSKENELPSINR